MTTTSIEWTQRPGTIGKTWNPTNGCEVCSPGCANCYAMRFAGRFSKPGERYHGLVSIAKNKRAIWTGEARLERHMLELPFSWRKPCTVFVNSMSDLFFDGFSNDEIAQVFDVMAQCPQHTFIILTKRARRMREWFAWAADRRTAWRGAALAAVRAWPLPNVWIGVSVENQDEAARRIPDLMATPAALRLLSCEPLLGELDLRSWLGYCERLDKHGITRGAGGRHSKCERWCGISWVIAGVESGPGARTALVKWFRWLRDQCSEAGVPFFLKQAKLEISGLAARQRVKYRSETAIEPMIGIGVGPRSKIKTGDVVGSPYLDGEQHHAYPEAA